MTETITKDYTSEDMIKMKALQDVYEEIEAAAESMGKDAKSELQMGIKLGLSSANNIVYKHINALGTVREQ